MRFYLLIALLFTTFIHGQLSDKHWLPPLHSRSASNVGEHVVYLSTPEVTPFQVSVTNGNGLPLGTYTISAGNPTQFTVGNNQPSDMFVTQAGLHTPSGNDGLILTGSSKFYVTFKIRSSAHGEVFVSKGRAGLGTDFRLGSSPQYSDDSTNGRNFVSSFMATEGNTIVTVSGYDTGVTFTTPTGTNNNGSQTFTLQAGQSVVISGYTDVSQNLTGFIGARLTSTKPVAVITGNMTANPTNNSGNDICLDQIVPVELIGTEYIVVKANGTAGTELPIVIATQDNTQVFVNGIAAPIATINAGDYYIVPFSYFQGSSNQNVYIETDKPVYLYQILAGSTDSYTIGMNFIPPLSCSFPKVVDLIPSINAIGSSSSFSSNIVLLAVAGSTITINGAPTTAMPQAVLGNPNWVTYRVSGYTGNVKVVSTGSTAVGVFGLSSTIGVASFYSGFGSVNLTYEVGFGIEESDMTIANGLAPCPGDIRVLDTGLDPADFTFEWTADIGDGNGPVLMTGETGPSYTVTAPGTYCVTTSNGFVGNSCTQTDCVIVEYQQGFLINNSPNDLTSCDNNFNLEDNTATILGSLDPFVYAVTFYATMQDAINTFPQISANQITTAQTTTFYAAVANTNFTCRQFAEFDAVVTPCVATMPPDMVVCDDITQNGTESFDLTTQTPIVLGILTPSSFTVTYHTTQAGADSPNGVLDQATPFTGYVGGPNQTIYVRMQSNANPLQYDTTTFNLVVLGLPNASIGSGTICEGQTGVVNFNGTPGATVHYLDNNGVTQTIVLDATSGMASVTTPVLMSDATYSLVDVVSNTTPMCTRVVNGSTTVLVNELPTVAISASATSICQGSSATVDFVGSLNSTITYTVNAGPNQTIVLDAFGNASISVSVTSTVCLVGAASNSSPVCNQAFTDCVTITVLALPTATIAGDDICFGETAVLTFTGTPNASVNYNLGTVPQASVTLGATGTATVSLTPSAGNYTYNLVDVTSNTSPACTQVVSGSATVSVLTAPPVNSVADIHVCDDNNDGFASFNLSGVEAQANGGDSSLTITIYETFSDADFPSSPLNSGQIASYQNINPDMQTLYIREQNAAGCYSITTVNLIVDPRPELNQNVTPYALCDINNPGDGIEVFDLTNLALTTNITNGVSGLALSYYTTLALAQANDPLTAIANPATYSNTSNPQTIWAVGENAAGCVHITSFIIRVNPLPAINPLADMNGCSDGVNLTQAPFDLILNDPFVIGTSGYTVSYYLNQIDANIPASPIDTTTPYIGTDGQVLIVRVENNATGCFATTPLQLNVTQGPVANMPTPLTYCDPNNDGFGEFNLQDALMDISAGPTPAGVTVTIHETPEDAAAGSSAIDQTVLYNNIYPYQQTLYVSVSYALTGCANYTELVLIVNPTPEIVAPANPVAECDDVLNDGIAIFDLTQVETEVLNGIDPSTVTITYHLSQSDANGPTGAIGNVLSYSGTNGQTIYIRVEFNATGCYSVESFILVVNPLPTMPAPEDITMNLCDVNNTGDQIECFDLINQIPSIVNGQTNMDVTFYLTQADAISGLVATQLPSPYCNTVLSVQSIFVRVENAVTGCFNTVIMDLRVEPLPTIVIPDPIEECGANQDGFATFDLTDLIIDMQNGDSTINITFYETFDNANTPTNVIANPSTYQNIDPFTQIVYVRAENSLTGCYTVEMIELIAHPAPIMPMLENLVKCDNNYDGFAYFDLSVQSPIILAANTITPLDIRYYTTLIDAQNGTSPIVPITYFYGGPFQQTIWVVVSDPATGNTVDGCREMTSFDLIIDLPIQPSTDNILTLCDEGLPNDQFTTFDLTNPTLTNQILINATTPGATITYYLTVAGAMNQTSSLEITNPGAFVNTIAAVQTLGVLVTGANGCTSVTTLTIRVEPLPTPNQGPYAALEACDDDQSMIGTELFDLTVNQTTIQDGYPNLTFTYYANQAAYDALPQVPIADPTMYEGPTSTVVIAVQNNRIDSNGKNCAVLVYQDIIVNPLPEVMDTTFVICDDDTDGMAQFTLSTYNAQLLGTTQSTADFSVSYYNSQANAQNVSSTIGLLPDSYNGTNLELIYPRVVNNTTGCINALAAVTLNVKLKAIANPISQATLDMFTKCDYYTANDGMEQFNLTIVETELLGAQTNPPITISYHLNPADQATADNPIANITAFENTSNPQTIYIRVERANDDGSLGNECYDVAEITLNVELLAEPVITSSTGYDIICVDYNTGDLISGLTLDSGIPTGSGYTYQWALNGTDITDGSGEGATYTVADASPGTYSVVVTSTSPQGCVSTTTDESMFVVVQSGPAANIQSFINGSFEETQTITIQNDGYGTYEYQLDGDGPWQSSPVFTNVPAGTHFVLVRDVTNPDYACDEQQIDNVSIINYPHFFTPNGDGINDKWNITGLNSQSNAKIYIFDRYGKLLKQISPKVNGGWDGTLNGQPLPATDYWFTVDYFEITPLGILIPKQFKAHFSLKR